MTRAYLTFSRDGTARRSKGEASQTGIERRRGNIEESRQGPSPRTGSVFAMARRSKTLRGILLAVVCSCLTARADDPKPGRFPTAPADLPEPEKPIGNPPPIPQPQPLEPENLPDLPDLPKSDRDPLEKAGVGDGASALGREKEEVVREGGGSAPKDEQVKRVRDREAGALVGDDPNGVKADSIGLGPRSVALTVDAQAPSAVNVGLPTVLKVVVRNVGKNDALGVVVRDVLPAGVDFLDAQPEPTNRVGSALVWEIRSLPTGGERVFKLRVKPTAVAPFDHLATVSLLTGSKSRTAVKQPKLKLELSAIPSGGKVLKGRRIKFNIVVSNPGSGSAGKAVVQAKLSSGLKHEEGTFIEQPLTAPIGPGESLTLDPLVVEAVQGGEQTCEISIRSPDVPQPGEEARVSQKVLVTEPKLKLSLSGPSRRITDTAANYVLALENTGTADAHRLAATAFLPLGGRLVAVPKGATWSSQSRRLTWNVEKLEPKERVEMSFKVLMGGIQRYQVDAEARAEGPLSARGAVVTEVSGMPDVRFEVVERTRALDVDEETQFEIKVRNDGSKDASALILNATVSSNLKAIEFDTGATDKNARYNPKTGKILFPQIDRLAPGAEMTLIIRVRAIRPGLATCQVRLMHADLGDEQLIREAVTRVMEAGATQR